MKLISLPIILLYFCVSESSSYTITKIDEIKGENVEQVNFDAEGNTYVLAEKKLFKLDASNKISSATDIQKRTWAPMLVSSRGDVYFFFTHVRDSDEYPKYIGFIMRVGPTGLELIDDANWYYLDRNENTIYYLKDFNVYVLRPNSSSSVPITNLKDFTFDSYYNGGIVTDKSGNTYIPVNSEPENSLAMISKEAIQEEMPQAAYLNVLDDDERVGYLMVDEENNLWIAISNKTFTKWIIKRLTKGNLKTILVEEGFTFIPIMMISKRNICYIKSVRENVTTIYYVTKEDEAVPIPELKHLDGSQEIHSVSDSEGQVYFYNTNNQLSDYLGKMVTVKANDTKPILISLRACENQTIHSVQVDFNDDVWILISEKLYHLKKGETVPNFANNVRGNCSIKADSRIHINFVTKRIYISCSDGLIVVN